MKHSIRRHAKLDTWHGFSGGKNVATFEDSDVFGTAEEQARDWLIDREFEEKVRRFSLGRIVRVTSAARTDVIGRITEVPRTGTVCVRVPGWMADGYPQDFYASVHDVEPATIMDLKTAVRKRGW